MGNPPLLLPLGSGLGRHDARQLGDMLSDAAARARAWGVGSGWRSTRRRFEPCFELVERALSVKEVTPELAGANAAVARRGAERLGWSHGYLRRNARGCVGSGVCVFGCPTSAKQHTGITYIPARCCRGGAASSRAPT